MFAVYCLQISVRIKLWFCKLSALCDCVRGALMTFLRLCAGNFPLCFRFSVPSLSDSDTFNFPLCGFLVFTPVFIFAHGIRMECNCSAALCLVLVKRSRRYFSLSVLHQTTCSPVGSGERSKMRKRSKLVGSRFIWFKRDEPDGTAVFYWLHRHQEKISEEKGVEYKPKQ